MINSKKFNRNNLLAMGIVLTAGALIPTSTALANDIKPTTSASVIVAKADLQYVRSHTKDANGKLIGDSINNNGVYSDHKIKDYIQQTKKAEQKAKKQKAEKKRLAKLEKIKSLEEAKKKLEQEAAKKAEEQKQAQEAAAAQQQAVSRPAVQSAPSNVAIGSGSAQDAFNRITAELGLSQAEKDGWAMIISRESGWNTTIANPSSGAYGLPQSLPASKMASAGSDYLTNPYTQLKWMHGYMVSRYGSVMGAVNYWLTNHNY